MKATLHNHTTYSDGVKTIKEIEEMARDSGISVVAITDHDTVEGYKDIINMDNPIKFIIGVEMSTVHKDHQVHILGYFNEISDEVVEYFKILKEKREERCKKIIDNLKKYEGIDISYEEVKKEASGTVGRPHIAAVISRKLGIESDEVFKKYIGDGCKCYEKLTQISTKDGVEFLKKNNALVSLAHPIQIKGFDFRELLDFGFDAIEAYHPDQDEKYSREVKKEAYLHNLILTGGSDYHGRRHHNIFGERYIEGEDVDIFLEKLEEMKQKKYKDFN